MRKCLSGLMAVAIAVCLATSAFAQDYQVSPSDKTITVAAQTVMDPTPDDQSPVDPSAVSSSSLIAGSCCPGAAAVWSGYGACAVVADQYCPQRRVLARRVNRCCIPVNQCCVAPAATCCEVACPTNAIYRRVVARPVIGVARGCPVTTNPCVTGTVDHCCVSVACATDDCYRRVALRPLARSGNCYNVATTGCCPTTVSNCYNPTDATYVSNPSPTVVSNDCGFVATDCYGYDTGYVSARPRLLFARLGSRRACR